MARNSTRGKVTDVDIRLLDVFRTVAACGGFTAAEFELNVGRSTISKHISDLETRLGFKLCHTSANATSRGTIRHDFRTSGLRMDKWCAIWNC